MAAPTSGPFDACSFSLLVLVLEMFSINFISTASRNFGIQGYSMPDQAGV
jgi:hypothetical protein